MADVREQILARLEVILPTVATIQTFARNGQGFADTNLPAIGLHDADETSLDAGAAGDGARYRPNHGPVRVAMAPRIVIALGDVPENVGTTVNAVRADCVKKILTDSTLQTLVGSNGQAIYLGCKSKLEPGRKMFVEFDVEIVFHYILLPANL